MTDYTADSLKSYLSVPYGLIIATIYLLARRLVRYRGYRQFFDLSSVCRTAGRAAVSAAIHDTLHWLLTYPQHVTYKLHLPTYRYMYHRGLAPDFLSR